MEETWLLLLKKDKKVKLLFIFICLLIDSKKISNEQTTKNYNGHTCHYKLFKYTRLHGFDASRSTIEKNL